MEFKEKTATEALEKIANAPLEHHWGCDQILIHGLHFSMDDVQAYAKATLNNQPKLSIPKKIAEELDGFNPNECETKIELLIVGYYKSFLSDELMSFCLANNGLNLCAFYLAGKALGVELVEVTDE